MSRLEELLARWDAGHLTAEEAAELKALLSHPENRAELVAEWRLDETLYDAFHTRLATAPSATARTTPNRAAVASPAFPPPARRRRWLVWREVHLSVGRLGWIGAAACAVLAAGWFYSEKRAAALLAEAPAGATIHRHGRDLAASPGQSLYPGDVLSASGTGTVAVTWPGETTGVSLAPGAKLEFLNPIAGKRLVLDAGALEAEVAPQSRIRPLVIRTPGAEATVVGTHFSLSVNAETSRLSVLEGAVKYRKTDPAAGHEPEVLVSAGQTSTAAKETPLTVQWLTGFLSQDAWLVPAGAALADAPQLGVPLPLEKGKPPVIPANSNVVERLRGYLLAPATGDFRFWVASYLGESPVELWLSPDESAGSKRRIAFEAPRPGSGPARTNPSLAVDLTRSPDQQSTLQPLETGHRYYIEIWHAGWDLQRIHFAWRLPDQPASAPPKRVDPDALCPFVDNPVKK